MVPLPDASTPTRIRSP